MTIKNVMSKAAIVAVSIGLAAASAYAGPPKDSGRPVIPEAIEDCKVLSQYNADNVLGTEPSDGEIRAFACSLLFKSDGALDDGVDKCKADPDYPDDVDGNGYVTYKSNNCAKNEAAQERKAASVVLSMNDVIKGKVGQSLTAAGYACDYAAKAEFLADVGKLEYAPGTNLMADAESIAAAIGYNCADF